MMSHARSGVNTKYGGTGGNTHGLSQMKRWFVRMNFPCHQLDVSAKREAGYAMYIDGIRARPAPGHPLGVLPGCQEPSVSSLGFVEIEARQELPGFCSGCFGIHKAELP